MAEAYHGIVSVDSPSPATVSLNSRAVSLAKNRCAVFPLAEREKVPRAGSRGYLDATRDPAQVAEWWTETPRANIGIATGSASGLIVVDVDPRHGGEESYRALVSEHGELPETRIVATGGGGYHIYLRPPDGVEISSRDLAPGVELKAEGRYIVAPPSIHPDTGRRYTVHNRAPVADVPTRWLAAFRDDSGPGSGEVSPRSNRPISVDLDGEPIPEGGRNRTLTRIAGKLRARGADRGELLDALQQINRTRCAPEPLPDSEVAAIVKSATRWERGTARPEPDAETRAALEDIAAGVESDPGAWRGVGGKTRRDVMVSLILAAREHGELIPAGVRVSISIRALALKAGTSSRDTIARATRWLREHGYLRRDDAERSGTTPGAFVLMRPREVGTLNHMVSQEEGNRDGETLVSRPCAPYSAPRLRWSAPEFAGGKRVGTILRVGKTAGAMLDALESAGGSLTYAELAERLGIARARDLRRHNGPLARLQDAEVVECDRDMVRLVTNWRDALEVERERAGEIAASRRDMARFARERDAFRGATPHGGRAAARETTRYYGLVETVDPETGEVLPSIAQTGSEPDPDPTRAQMDERRHEREQRQERAQAEISRLAPVAAMFADPPPWLRNQLALYFRERSERLLRPLIAAVRLALAEQQAPDEPPTVALRSAPDTASIRREVERELSADTCTRISA